MLYLSIILFFPVLHSFLTPLFIKPLCFKDTLYYYLSYLFFFSFSGAVGLTTFSYSILKMDIIKWGKTRLIEHAIVGSEAERKDNKELTIDINPEVHYDDIFV